jgi:hypothetical protein
MSTPHFQEFNPQLIEWQSKATDAFEKFDYSKGIYEQFFSGSVGSAKTIEHIHLIVRHCLENDGARYLMVRRALKDLKRTSWNVLISHMADIPQAIESYNRTEMKITFKNGSEIIGDSYDKGDLDKFRSLELSGADFEEVTECPREVYEAVKMRVGRLPKVKENIITSRCNPDSPSHWLYEYFIESKSSMRQVFYSLTEQNPFLPKWYVENLRADLDPKMALRMLKGQWIEIAKENVYYNYDDAYCYRDSEYKWDTTRPLDLFIDFNNDKAGTKPMSVGAGQFIRGSYHAGKAWLIAGMRTLDMMDEVAESGLLDGMFPMIRVYGDASGRASDTRSNRSDWDLIENFLSNHRPRNRTRLEYEIEVPLANPPIKERHNLMNAMFKNDLGLTRFFIYKDAKDLAKGFRLTQLKKNARLIEDDSLREQHITTAAGYYVYRNELLTKDIAPLVIS